MKRSTSIAATVPLMMASLNASAMDITLANPLFHVIIGSDAGGITSLKRTDDRIDTNYVWDGRAIGQIVMRFRRAGDAWTQWESSSQAAIRTTTQDAPERVTVAYASSGTVPGPLAIHEGYALEGDALVWTITIANGSSTPIEIGDLGTPLPFATDYSGESAATFNKSVIRHSFISGDGSFIYCQRPSGVGPYLVMTPAAGTHLEYYTDREYQHDRHRIYTAYIHALVQANETDAGGTWRQPISSKTLAAAGSAGDTVTYSFRFTWAKDYAGVRQALVREGLIDVRTAPGMVIPQGMPAMFSLKTRQRILSVEAEFPDETTVRLVKTSGPDTRVYRIWFRRLGENRLTVNYGDGARLYLEFFSTQPLETLIRKRADFMVRKQLIRGTGKWYDGLFSLWDMRSGVLRSPDDTGGLRAYMVGGSDDPSNCKAPYLALKNLSFPVQSEIDAIEYHLQHFVWGGLQRKETETPYPFGIYGIDNWHVNRTSADGFGSGGNGQEHLWRSFDYPAMFTLYHAMYKIAKRYPGMTQYLDAQGYLDRAFGTAKAFFVVPYSIKAWWGGYPDWTYMTGEYNEVCLPELIDDLYREGRAADAYWLKRELEKKVKYFVYDNPYPYGSEYPFDSTAYETSHMLAKYGVTHELKPDTKLWKDHNSGQWYSHPKVEKSDFEAFLGKQMSANIADRGWLEPAYYLMGSDIRGGGNAHYLLSYMAQMGGWAVLDYALNYSPTPEDHIALGYASYLSSWALVNAGDAKSNYGYWFPGEKNDGAAAWAYEPLKVAKPWYGLPQGRGAWGYDGEIDHGFMGALRTAATIVVNDPVFGLFAYGGSVTRTPDGVKVIPMDGLRQRVYFQTLKPAVHMELEQDGFVTVRLARAADGAPRRLAFSLENRSGPAHQTVLNVSGLPPGRYAVSVGRSRRPIRIAAAGATTVVLDIPARPACRITIERIGAVAAKAAVRRPEASRSNT
ncbi:MAG TPA: DUF5695 domain-containing protein [Armatimonadota bacterium]|jgi:hypothetical protein